MIKFTLKVILAKRETTQKELAALTGIRPATISAMSLGTISRVPVDALDKICTVLDCQPADIMEYIPSAPTSAKNGKAT